MLKGIRGKPCFRLYKKKGHGLYYALLSLLASGGNNNSNQYQYLSKAVNNCP